MRSKALSVRYRNFTGQTDELLVDYIPLHEVVLKQLLFNIMKDKWGLL